MNKKKIQKYYIQVGVLLQVCCAGMQAVMVRIPRHRQWATLLEYCLLASLVPQDRLARAVLISRCKGSISPFGSLWTSPMYCVGSTLLSASEDPSGHTHACFQTGFATLTSVLYAGNSMIVVWR